MQKSERTGKRKIDSASLESNNEGRELRKGEERETKDRHNKRK